MLKAIQNNREKIKMQELPIKYILDRGFHEVGHYFQELVKNKRMENKVAVHYNDINESLLFVECDIHGFPKIRYFEFLTIMGLPKLMSEDFASISETTTQVYKKCVEIREPEIIFKMENGTLFGENYYFMWRGEIRDKHEIPLEQLDIKYLTILAQEVIKKREPIILDDVIKNKLIK